MADQAGKHEVSEDAGRWLDWMAQSGGLKHIVDEHTTFEASLAGDGASDGRGVDGPGNGARSDTDDAAKTDQPFEVALALPAAVEVADVLGGISVAQNAVNTSGAVACTSDAATYPSDLKMKPGGLSYHEQAILTLESTGVGTFGQLVAKFVMCGDYGRTPEGQPVMANVHLGVSPGTSKFRSSTVAVSAKVLPTPGGTAKAPVMIFNIHFDFNPNMSGKYSGRFDYELDSNGLGLIKNFAQETGEYDVEGGSGKGWVHLTMT